MRIVEIKVFKFDELSQKVQESIVNNLQDINVDYEWWDSVYEDAANIGLVIKGFDLDRKSYVDGRFTEDCEGVAYKIISEHGESCDTVKTAKDYLVELKKLTDEYEKEHPDEDYPIDFIDTDDIDREFLRSLCEDYRIMLQKEYDYRMSNAAIIESIKANEFEFTEDGKQY